MDALLSVEMVSFGVFTFSILRRLSHLQSLEAIRTALKALG